MGRLTGARGVFLGGVATFAALAVLVGLVTQSSASTPTSQTVAAPTAPGTTTVTWTGTIPAGLNPTSDYNTGLQSDEHTIDLQVPAGFYDSTSSSATFEISWADAANDEILTVNDPDGGEIGSSDSGAPPSGRGDDLSGGEYQVLACGFSATGRSPTPASSTIHDRRQRRLASVGRRPRPLVLGERRRRQPARRGRAARSRSTATGNMYTCGPTGFSNASDYAQVSTDGGDQFHLLGSLRAASRAPAAAAIAASATGVKRNAHGNFQYAYSRPRPADRLRRARPRRTTATT